jgi:hypothetical protein
MEKAHFALLRAKQQLQGIIHGASAPLVRATLEEKGRLGGLPLGSAYSNADADRHQTTSQHLPGCGRSQCLVVLTRPVRINLSDFRALPSALDREDPGVTPRGNILLKDALASHGITLLFEKAAEIKHHNLRVFPTPKLTMVPAMCFSSSDPAHLSRRG